MGNKQIINIDEVRDIFIEDEKFDEKEFQKFLEFLEVDFYDWVKENLKQFNSTKN